MKIETIKKIINQRRKELKYHKGLQGRRARLLELKRLELAIDVEIKQQRKKRKPETPKILYDVYLNNTHRVYKANSKQVILDFLGLKATTARIKNILPRLRKGRVSGVIEI